MKEGDSSIEGKMGMIRLPCKVINYRGEIMAVRVTPSRGMNGLSQKNFEEATKYSIEDNYLHIYAGNKRISSYAPGCWESVDLYTPLDQRKAGMTEQKKKPGLSGIAAPPNFGLIDQPLPKSRAAGQIRTSPHRSEGRVSARGTGKKSDTPVARVSKKKAR